MLAAIALWSRVARAAPLPVYFVGVGEKLADLQTFRAREFAQALLELSAALSAAPAAAARAVTDPSSSSNQVEPCSARATSMTSPWRPVAIGVGERIDRRAASTATRRSSSALGHRRLARRRSRRAGRQRLLAPCSAARPARCGRILSRAASIVGSVSSFQTWSGMLGRLQDARHPVEPDPQLVARAARSAAGPRPPRPPAR